MHETNARRRTRTRIAGNDPGGPLLDYMAARFTYLDRGEWLALVNEGRLLVNERPASSQALLRPGDRIECLLPDRPEPPVNGSFRIVFEDDVLLVVDKPADLPCHPAGPYFHNTLWWRLRSRMEEKDPLSLVNRIDRETSGLVLAAKARWAGQDLGRQFRKRRVFKRYLAIVEGAFPLKEVEARGFLAPDPASAVRKRRRYVPTRQALGPDTRSESCRTRLCGLGVHGSVSLVEAVPLTGRTHQIRATLFGLGYPVVGDKIYGPDEGCFLRFIREGLTSKDRQRLRLRRQALHAAEIRIAHPAAGRPLRFFSAMPGDMRAILESGGKAMPWERRDGFSLDT